MSKKLVGNNFLASLEITSGIDKMYQVTLAAVVQ
jgi:hypothetical protein